MILTLYLGIILLVLMVIAFVLIAHKKRMIRLSALIAPVVQESTTGRVQQLKNHHESEMVLEKQSLLLGYFRKLDGSIIHKVGLMLVLTGTALASDALFSLELSQNTLLLLCLLALVVAIVLPGKVRQLIVARRIKALSVELPWLVDLLAVCVQCGMSLEAAFMFVSQKMGGINPDFTPFLDRLVKRSEVSGLSEALKRFLVEIPCQENRMLCATLEQSLKYGSSVYEQLVMLSQEIREYQVITLEEKIGSLGAKMSVPLILFFMIPVVIVVAAPGIMRIMGDV